MPPATYHLFQVGMVACVAPPHHLLPLLLRAAPTAALRCLTLLKIIAMGDTRAFLLLQPGMEGRKRGWDLPLTAVDEGGGGTG